MSLMRASQHFVLAVKRPRLKNLPSDLVRRHILSDTVPKACLKSRTKKIPKSVGARTHPCLTPLWMSNGLEELSLNCTVPFMFVWKDSIMLCNSGEQPIFGRIWKRLSADKIKHLCEVNEGDIQGHLLFSALFLKLAKGEDHVYCWPSSSEAAL